MRIPFFVATALSCIWIGCGGTTNVDDLFTPTPTGGKGTGGSGGASTGGTGGSGGSGGSTTAGTGGVAGSGGSATGGMGGGGTGGTGGGGTSGTGGVSGTSGTGGTGGTGGTVVDSGADVRRDAAVDARDAGKGGSIRCGTGTCDPSVQFCCLTSGNIRCVATTATTCAASSDRLHCDDTADCPTGQICCVTAAAGGMGADGVCALTTAGCGAPKNMLCDPAVAAPCLNIAGLVCSANGSGIISDYAYCHAP